MQTKIMKATYRGMNKPMILDTVSRDAEIYFAVIATSHLLTVIMYGATRVRFSVPVFELTRADRWVYFISQGYGPYL
jgi:hypothetical protein